MAVGQHRLDQLELGDRLAELAAFHRVAGGLVQDALTLADAHRRDIDAATVEALHRGRKAAPLDPADDRVCRNAHVVEVHIGRPGAGMAHLAVVRADGDARQAGRHQEGADVGVTRQALRRRARHDQE